MNRKVGGLGHDPKTEPVEAQVEKNNFYCFEDQTVAEAEANYVRRKGRRSSCSNARKIAGGNNKS